MTVLSSIETDAHDLTPAAIELAYRIEAAQEAQWCGKESARTFALVVAHARELGIDPQTMPTPTSLDLTAGRLEKWSRGENLPDPKRMSDICEWLARTIAQVEAGAAA